MCGLVVSKSVLVTCSTHSGICFPTILSTKSVCELGFKLVVCFIMYSLVNFKNRLLRDLILNLSYFRNLEIGSDIPHRWQDFFFPNTNFQTGLRTCSATLCFYDFTRFCLQLIICLPFVPLLFTEDVQFLFAFYLCYVSLQCYVQHKFLQL